jgi:hypothetical protein
MRNAHPSDMPIERPTHFDLAINLKTAKVFGLTIAPALLGRADQVSGVWHASSTGRSTTSRLSWCRPAVDPQQPVDTRNPTPQSGR